MGENIQNTRVGSMEIKVCVEGPPNCKFFAIFGQFYFGSSYGWRRKFDFRYTLNVYSKSRTWFHYWIHSKEQWFYQIFMFEAKVTVVFVHTHKTMKKKTSLIAKRKDGQNLIYVIRRILQLNIFTK